VASRSVRTRITATALGVVGTALVLAGFLLLALLQRSLVGGVDTQATMRAQDVAALVARRGVPPALVGQDDGTVAQVVARGRVLVQSPVIRETQPLAGFVPDPGKIVVRTVDRAAIGDDAGPYRVAAIRADGPDGPVVVYAAATLEPVTDSIVDTALILSVVVPLLIVLVGVTTWRLVGRTLGPVEAIRRQVAEISAAALDRRVPVPGTGDEVDRLARTMNEMLDRLDAAAHRQRAFVADASHELRSPLTAVRAKLEVGLDRAGSVDWPALARSWLAEQERLEHLVDDLLLLARVDEGVDERGQTVVDLDELVLRQARDVRSREKVRVEVSEVTGGRVRGDADQLRRVVANLFDNAERHAATTVRCALRQDGATVELVVSDDGPGIAAADRERVFERFVRLDEARNRRGGGSGLGLAIVRDIVTAHGGTAEVADTGAGARFVVRLPVPSAP
jgi:signal transduction histidine kinase